MFVFLSVFVLLNMLIAIIADAYEFCVQEKKKAPEVNLVKEVKEYVIRRLLAVPVCGQVLGKICFRKRAKILAATGSADLPDDVAKEEASKSTDAKNAEAESTQNGNNASVSDMILLEWFDSLKQNEEDWEVLHKEVFTVKRDMGDMKKDLGLVNEKLDNLATRLGSVVHMLGKKD